MYTSSLVTESKSVLCRKSDSNGGFFYLEMERDSLCEYSKPASQNVRLVPLRTASNSICTLINDMCSFPR